MRSRHILHTGHSIQNQVTLAGDHLGFSSFLDMLIHTIEELFMQNYSSVPQTVPEIWLTLVGERVSNIVNFHDIHTMTLIS